jgi:hypothetical protein
LKVHDVDEWLHPTLFYENLITLQQRGYSLDFVSDKMLGNASVNNGVLKVSGNGAAHKVLVVSKCRFMPVETMQNIIRLAKAGAVVIMQEFPEDVPGFANLEEKRKRLRELVASLRLQEKGPGIREMALGKGRIVVANDVIKALAYAGIQRETLADAGLKFIRRAVDNGKYYYIVNHTPKAVNATLPIQYAAGKVVMMDPQTGEAGLAAFTKKGPVTNVRLQLEPGQAIILKVSKEQNGSGTTAKWRYLERAQQPIALNGTWRLHFKEGGPELPAVKTMTGVQPWTAFTDDSTTQSFSGTGVYSTTFTLPAKKASDYLLQLGKVHESAKVFINGKEVGILWSIPYQARIGRYLKEGENTLTIEVASLMANRIRHMDRMGMEWRRYHEINFVNIDYKNFDASEWEVQVSGLKGPVTITPFIMAPGSSTVAKGK